MIRYSIRIVYFNTQNCTNLLRRELESVAPEDEGMLGFASSKISSAKLRRRTFLLALLVADDGLRSSILNDASKSVPAGSSSSGAVSLKYGSSSYCSAIVTRLTPLPVACLLALACTERRIDFLALERSE